MGIRTFLKLNNPISERTASYGHFGRQPDDSGGFSWEKLNSIKLFQQLIG
jgi:S-adenosylmethionine synthetase